MWITPGLEATMCSVSMEGAMAMEKANVPKVLWGFRGKEEMKVL